MKARDVLADCLNIGKLADLPPHIAERLMSNQDRRIDALLAQTPEGEGVYIAPDGTLMRVERTTVAETCGFIEDDDVLYRLVPIEEATDD